MELPLTRRKVKKALLIIDMQRGSFPPSTCRYDSDGVIQRINMLADLFRKNGDRVIFVLHDGSKDHSFVPGTDDWQILPSLSLHAGDTVVAKTANDSFYRTELLKILAQDQIRCLFITGCATDFCVASTVPSALVHDYEVTVIGDCHTTADRPHLNARRVIEYHNWLWQNMIPTGGRIHVVSSSELLQSGNAT